MPSVLTMTCRIPLDWHGNRHALVSDEDYHWLTALGLWHASPGAAGNYYARRIVSRDSGKRSVLYMHRAIVKPPAGYVVDHINGDSLDNRRENLRVCTTKENAANRAFVTACGFHGVRKHGSRWQARLLGKSLGMFDTAEEAARVWDAAALREFGDFARLNFPRREYRVSQEPPF